VLRRTHPLCKGDFELLQAELEGWRQQQAAAIKAASLPRHEEQVCVVCDARARVRGMPAALRHRPCQPSALASSAACPAARLQAALQLMLAKETRLLQALDRLRVNAHHEHRAHATQQQLGRLAAPTTWSLSNGKQVCVCVCVCVSSQGRRLPRLINAPCRCRCRGTCCCRSCELTRVHTSCRAQVLVHTPSTVRAAELQQLYRGLMLGSLSLDERLDVLLHVKWVAKECDCALTRELVALIDREADLLNRCMRCVCLCVSVRVCVCACVCASACVWPAQCAGVHAACTDSLRQ
jgi:hypothetical protein